MSETTESRQRLQPVLERVRRSIRLVRDRKDHIGEAQTKTALIDPVLVSLGWDTTDLEEVSLEYRHKPKDNPVDYALFVRRSVCLFVEAKALDTNLDDHKWKSQVVNYANAAGVEWCVLTDGDRYCIYNSHAPVDVEQKLFRSITISDPTQAQFTLDTLSLLSKEKLSDNLLSVLWKAHFVDRNVQAALKEMLGEQDGALIRLIRRRTAELSPSEIKESIRRAHIVIDYPESPLPVGQPAASASIEEGGQAGEAEWGPRSYKGPLQLDGSVIVLSKYRPFLKKTVEQRVSLEHVRRTAETACALRDAGQLVSLPAIRKHPGGPRSGGSTQRALGAMYLAGAITFAEGQYTDSFQIVDGLTAEGIVQRVLAKAEGVSAAQGTQAKRESASTKERTSKPALRRDSAAEAHLEGRAEARSVFDALLRQTRETVGEFSVHANSKHIVFSNRSAFVVISVLRKGLRIGLRLNVNEVEHHPRLRVQPRGIFEGWNAFCVSTSLSNPGEVDDELLALITRAHAAAS